MLPLVLALLLAFLGTSWFLRQLYPINHRELVMQHAALNELDPYWVAAVIRAESGWNPAATSRKGAAGLMQVMPATAVWVAGQMGFTDYDPKLLYEPAINIRLGTWYLAYLLKRFDGNRLLALAAYNAGEHNVNQWLIEKRWLGTAEAAERIPFPETRRYVQRTLHSYEWYRRIYRSWPTGN